MIPHDLPSAFEMMGRYPQWILWQMQERDGKLIKCPVSNEGYAVNAQDPATWSSFPDAVGRANTLREKLQSPINIGFSFTAADPFFFVDVDHAIDADGVMSPMGQWARDLFPDAAFEISQSGTGFHMFGVYTHPVEHSNKNKELGLELYVDGRFCAMTFEQTAGSIYDYTAAYHAFAGSYFPPKSIARTEIAWDKGPDPEWSGPADDDALWAKIFNEAPNMQAQMKGLATWRELFDGDIAALAHTYPSTTGEPFDWSSADFALMAKLAFYTGRDPARMERMFSMSALAQRDKWNGRDGYRRRTIEKQIVNCDAVYDDRKGLDLATPENPPAVLPEAPPSAQILDPTHQLAKFYGCTYLADRNRILTPLGDFYTEKQFRSMFGGHTFMLDWEGGKTSNAWEAFVESRVNQPNRAHTSTFRPLDPPGSMYLESGRTLVNSYVPQGVVSSAGDASPFVELTHRMISNARAREIYVSYLAFCIQHPGIKAQWAPVIQGVDGNGKSLVAMAVSKAIGERYSHFADARDLDNKFNGWLAEKLLIIVEEIRTAHTSDVMEALKPYITNERIAMQPKGVDQVTGDNVANFLFNTNYKDAVRKTLNDRRYCNIFTDQQEVADLARCGMDGDYFPNLWAWAKTGGGWAIIAHYLQTYAIAEEFNPALRCHRAPETSSTAEAMLVSRSPDEQRVQEAIESCELGFRNGWVSSVQLQRVFEHERAGPTRLRNAVVGLGYIPHPALYKGRCTTNLVSEGNKRPTLYVLPGSIISNLPQDQVATAYQKAQNEQPAIIVGQGVTHGT